MFESKLSIKVKLVKDVIMDWKNNSDQINVL